MDELREVSTLSILSDSVIRKLADYYLFVRISLDEEVR